MSDCVVIKGLRVSFGEREILHGVDARFPANRVSVILGRSGSGKSTLLRSLNRLNECFDGYRGEGEVRVLLGGALVPVEGGGAPALTELRRRVGMVFQSPNPLPVSIRRNITLPLELAARARLPSLRGATASRHSADRVGQTTRLTQADRLAASSWSAVSKRACQPAEICRSEAQPPRGGWTSPGEIEENVKATLMRTGLWEEVRDRLDAPAQSLSGGQQQRLCLTRALALKPDLLLLDEPTASLDRTAAQRVEDMILSLREKLSVIMVSHSLQQAAKLADYAVVMGDGQVLQTFDGAGLNSALDDGSLVKLAF